MSWKRSFKLMKAVKKLVCSPTRARLFARQRCLPRPNTRFRLCLDVEWKLFRLLGLRCLINRRFCFCQVRYNGQSLSSQLLVKNGFDLKTSRDNSGVEVVNKQKAKLLVLLSVSQGVNGASSMSDYLRSEEKTSKYWLRQRDGWLDKVLHFL